MDDLSPSLIARRNRERRRNICGICWPSWSEAIQAGLVLLRKAVPTDPETGRPPAGSESDKITERAFSDVLYLATEAATQILAAWEKKGRRPPIALNIAVEVFYARGFTDAQIGALCEMARGQRWLNVATMETEWKDNHVLNDRYVTRRRAVADIRRLR